MEAVSCQLSTSLMACITAESAHDANQALVDTRGQKHPDLEKILAEAGRLLDDHSPIICSASGLFCYDVDRLCVSFLGLFFAL